MSNKRQHRYPAFAYVIAALFAAIVLGGLLAAGLANEPGWYAWWPHVSRLEIEQFIRSFGPWGVAASIAVMVIHSFVPFPAELVAIANGMLYGPVWGTVITWTGAMLGALLAFGLARMLGRPVVRRLLSETNNKLVDDWVRVHAGGALLFSRFIPVIAFNLINYAAGLTTVSWWTFVWTTSLGILPLTTLMVVMGHHIETLPWYAWLLLLISGLVLWLITHRLLWRSDNGTPHDDNDLPASTAGKDARSRR